MKVGEKIKDLRIEAGLSQMRLAKAVGVSQKAVDYWERGVNEPKVSYVIELVKVFNISYEEFFSDLD
ncbi:MAG: helix-turn-helix transcriptional regulator [Clostridia bacterium]|nr:helix-turn-helix transcriptional regulator [Clostridia bacterium]